MRSSPGAPWRTTGESPITDRGGEVRSTMAQTPSIESEAASEQCLFVSEVNDWPLQ